MSQPAPSYRRNRLREVRQCARRLVRMVGGIVTAGMAWAPLVGFSIIMAVALRLNLRGQFGVASCLGGRKRDRIV